MSVSLLLIDDHPLFRRGLAGMFSASGDFDVVGEAAGGREGIELARRLRPDVVLLDLHMPGLGGLQVLDEIRQLGFDSLVIVLTAQLERQELLAALHLGVDGYVLKETEPEALLSYVRACRKGDIVLSDDMVSLLARHVHPPQAPAAPPQALQLTTREAQTLALIAQARNNKEIAREFGISDGTVKIYVKNLLRKLGLRSRLELAAWAHRTSFDERHGQP